MSALLGIMNKLLKEASLYLDLIKTNKGEIRISIELLDTREVATLTLGEKIEVIDSSVNPDCKISMKRQVLKDIVEGRADVFALAGRGRADEVRPIEFEIYNKERLKEIWETVRALLTYFFIPGRIKVRNLRPELAGYAHGAHPIPILYWNGLRFAWYIVKAGEILNKEKTKDPWPQMFIILKGKGKVIIQDEQFEIKPNTVIYIPRNSIHQITAKEDVELFWMAWQTH
ncbi:MAG TPA: cupin domain-containing protein [Candidatus Bathyarchaeota archaeon]|nr:cupin domain-containing protein [Candidatus Bathyarchaeota archaeon]